jgi:hypothetical protein
MAGWSRRERADGMEKVEISGLFGHLADPASQKVGSENHHHQHK